MPHHQPPQLATAAKADTLVAFSWFVTIARGLTGIGVGGEYPSSSVSAVEAANEKFMKKRGMTFILVTVRLLSLSAVFSKS
jgi:MFS family permease